MRSRKMETKLFGGNRPLRRLALAIIFFGLLEPGMACSLSSFLSAICVFAAFGLRSQDLVDSIDQGNIRFHQHLVCL